MEFIFTPLLIIIFFSVLIIGHEIGHFAAAKLLKLDVKEFGLGLPPKIFGKKWRDTEYSLNLIPFGGFVTVPAIDYSAEDSFKISAWKKAIIFSSGVAMNFLIAWMAFSAIFMIGMPKGVYIGQVIDNSPAMEAGLQSGDKILNFYSITPLIELINANVGEKLILEVGRQGEVLTTEVTPRLENGIGKIGVELISGFPREGFFQSFWSGLRVVWNFIAIIINALVSMFRYGDFTGVTGPIGIFSAVQTAQNMGVIYFLQLIGMVSLSLAVLNILPFPALDGGHIMFLIFEKIRRKPISKKILIRVNSFGYAFLLALMFIVTVRDIIDRI